MSENIQILFVDDQWGTAKGRDVIIGAFGALAEGDPPYEFHYETGEISPGCYGAEPVLKHIDRIRDIFCSGW